MKPLAIPTILIFIAPLLFAADAPPKPQREPLHPFTQVRPLTEHESTPAANARDAADLLRAEHEKQYHPGKDYPKNDPKAQAQFADIVKAYTNVSANYPATDIDCYCRLRLSGAYQYRGDFDKALDEAQKAAELFAGHPQGDQAEMAVGLIYLQALHQPQNALPHFRRMQSTPLSNPEEQAKWRAAATELIARCEREAAPQTRPARH